MSWNIQGQGGPINPSKVFSYLKGLDTDDVFLQEIHLRINDHCRMRKPWVGEIFHSAFNSKFRGTAILINKHIQFSPDQIIYDPKGQYVIVSGTLNQTLVVLIIVYAPNFMTLFFKNSKLKYSASYCRERPEPSNRSQTCPNPPESNYTLCHVEDIIIHHESIGLLRCLALASPILKRIFLCLQSTPTLFPD